MVFKELIFNTFYFGRVWWSSKNSVLTVSTLAGVVVFKELIFNSFYFGRSVVVFKELILTVSTLGQVCVVLKELSFNSF